MNGKYYINDKDDMFVFCEVINEIEPVSVLDVGAFMKRCGCISRGILDQKLPDMIERLDAIDLREAPHLNVYNTIYDNIYIFNRFKEQNEIIKYDLAIALKINDILEENKIEIYKYVGEKTRYIFTDDEQGFIRAGINKNYNGKQISLDNRNYYLFSQKG